MHPEQAEADYVPYMVHELKHLMDEMKMKKVLPTGLGTYSELILEPSERRARAAEQYLLQKLYKWYLNKISEPSSVANITKDFGSVSSSGVSPTFGGDGARDKIKQKLDEILTVSKSKIYVSDPSEAPKGRQIEEGPRGGKYYETSNMKMPKDVQLTAKQPWEMTRREYNEVVPEVLEKLSGKITPSQARSLNETDPTYAYIHLTNRGWNRFISHKKIIAKALSEGKPVPAEVLKDYPDLAKGVQGTEIKKSTELTTLITKLDNILIPSVVKKQYGKRRLIPIRTFVRHSNGVMGSAVRWMKPERVGAVSLKVKNNVQGVINPNQIIDFVKNSVAKQTFFYPADSLDIDNLKNNGFINESEHSIFGLGIYVYGTTEGLPDDGRPILPVKVNVSKPYILTSKYTGTKESLEDMLVNFGYDSVIIYTSKPMVYNVFVFDSEDISVIGDNGEEISSLYKSEGDNVVFFNTDELSEVAGVSKDEITEEDDDGSLLEKAVIQTPINEKTGAVDYERVPSGQSIWVTVTAAGSPLAGRHIMLTKRPDGLFALTGGAGSKYIKDKYGGGSSKEDALRHLVVTGRPNKTKRDVELEDIAEEAAKFNEPLIEKRKELFKYGKEEIQKAYDAFTDAVGISTKLTVGDLKKHRDEIIQKAQEVGKLSEEEANNFASSVIRHYAAGERTVVEKRRRDAGLKLFTRLREMKEGVTSEEEAINNINNDFSSFKGISVDLPSPEGFKGLSKEEMDGKIGDYVNEKVSEVLNPNPDDASIDEELASLGLDPEGKKVDSISFEIGEGIKPLEIKDAGALKEAAGKFLSYSKVKSEINAVKGLIEPNNFKQVTPSFLEQLREQVKATSGGDVTEDDLMEIEKSYDTQWQQNNTALSMYSAISEFWNDETSIRKKIGRTDNSFGGYTDSGAISALAALTGKYLGKRIETGSLIGKTNVETAALAIAFSLRDELQEDSNKYDSIINNIEAFNSKNQIDTEKIAMDRHKDLKTKYQTIQNEKAAGTLTSKAFLLEAETNNLIEQKKNLGTALGSLQASAAMLAALYRAKSYKENMISINFGKDRESAVLRKEELRLGHRIDIDDSDPDNIRVVTSARALQRYVKGLDVIKENQDEYEKLKTNMSGTFEDDEGKDFVKDYEVPFWKDKWKDEDGNEHDHHFR
ncbi:MAG: hypothetical protein Q8Q31_02695, partial [Nanoarchaeota archaeon]|nr:hypothetical protein [Nanoarchaeota archaeon]